VSFDADVRPVARIAICFDKKSTSEKNYDYLQLLSVKAESKDDETEEFAAGESKADVSGRRLRRVFPRGIDPDGTSYLCEKFSGSADEANWPAESVSFIDADQFNAKFVSDNSNGEWGFRFAALPVYEEAPKFNEKAQQARAKSCTEAGEKAKAAFAVFCKGNHLRTKSNEFWKNHSKLDAAGACDVSLPAGVSAWHRAEEAVTDDEGRVCSWPDASGNGVTLVLPDAQGSAPSLVPASKTFPAYVRFAKCENEGLVYPDSFRLAGNDVAGNDENADLLQYSVFIVNRYYGSSPNGRTLQSRDTNWL
jgi:hypothetical protein